MPPTRPDKSPRIRPAKRETARDRKSKAAAIKALNRAKRNAQIAARDQRDFELAIEAARVSGELWRFFDRAAGGESGGDEEQGEKEQPEEEEEKEEGGGRSGRI